MLGIRRVGPLVVRIRPPRLGVDVVVVRVDIGVVRVVVPVLQSVGERLGERVAPTGLVVVRRRHAERRGRHRQQVVQHAAGVALGEHDGGMPRVHVVEPVGQLVVVDVLRPAPAVEHFLAEDRCGARVLGRVRPAAVVEGPEQEVVVAVHQPAQRRAQRGLEIGPRGRQDVRREGHVRVDVPAGIEVLVRRRVRPVGEEHVDVVVRDVVLVGENLVQPLRAVVVALAVVVRVHAAAEQQDVVLAVAEQQELQVVVRLHDGVVDAVHLDEVLVAALDLPDDALVVRRRVRLRQRLPGVLGVVQGQLQVTQLVVEEDAQVERGVVQGGPGEPVLVAGLVDAQAQARLAEDAQVHHGARVVVRLERVGIELPADVDHVVLDLAIGRRAVRHQPALPADPEPHVRPAGHRVVRHRHRNGVRAAPLKARDRQALVRLGPLAVAVPVDPRIHHAAAPVDEVLDGRRHALDHGRDADAVLVVVAVERVVAAGEGLRHAVAVNVRGVAIVAQPGPADLVPRAVVDGQRRIARRLPAVRRVAEVHRLDVEGDLRLGGVGLPVVGDVQEAVRPGIARVGRVEEAAVGVHGQRAVLGVGDAADGQRVALRVDVAPEAVPDDGKLVVLAVHGDDEVVVPRHRRVVDGLDRHEHGGLARLAGLVLHDVRELVPAVVVPRGRVEDSSLEQLHRAVGGLAHADDRQQALALVVGEDVDLDAGVLLGARRVVDGLDARRLAQVDGDVDGLVGDRLAVVRADGEGVDDVLRGPFVHRHRPVPLQALAVAQQRLAGDHRLAALGERAVVHGLDAEAEGVAVGVPRLGGGHHLLPRDLHHLPQRAHLELPHFRDEGQFVDGGGEDLEVVGPAGPGVFHAAGVGSPVVGIRASRRRIAVVVVGVDVRVVGVGMPVLQRVGEGVDEGVAVAELVVVRRGHGERDGRQRKQVVLHAAGEALPVHHRVVPRADLAQPTAEVLVFHLLGLAPAVEDLLVEDRVGVRVVVVRVVRVAVLHVDAVAVVERPEEEVVVAVDQGRQRARQRGLEIGLGGREDVRRVGHVRVDVGARAGRVLVVSRIGAVGVEHVDVVRIQVEIVHQDLVEPPRAVVVARVVRLRLDAPAEQDGEVLPVAQIGQLQLVVRMGQQHLVGPDLDVVGLLRLDVPLDVLVVAARHVRPGQPVAVRVVQRQVEVAVVRAEADVEVRRAAAGGRPGVPVLVALDVEPQPAAHLADRAQVDRRDQLVVRLQRVRHVEALADVEGVVLHLAVGGLPPRQQVALAADPEAGERPADGGTDRRRDVDPVHAVRQGLVEDVLAEIVPVAVGVPVNPDLHGAPAAVDEHLDGRRRALHHVGHGDAVLVVVAVELVVALGVRVGLAVGVEVGPVPVIAQPRPPERVPGPVVGQQRRVSRHPGRIRRVAEVQVLLRQRLAPQRQGVDVVGKRLGEHLGVRAVQRRRVDHARVQPARLVGPRQPVVLVHAEQHAEDLLLAPQVQPRELERVDVRAFLQAEVLRAADHRDRPGPRHLVDAGRIQPLVGLVVGAEVPEELLSQLVGHEVQRVDVIVVLFGAIGIGREALVDLDLAGDAVRVDHVGRGDRRVQRQADDLVPAVRRAVRLARR